LSVRGRGGGCKARSQRDHQQFPSRSHDRSLKSVVGDLPLRALIVINSMWLASRQNRSSSGDVSRACQERVVWYRSVSIAEGA
jgi:hypothetical protein